MQERTLNVFRVFIAIGVLSCIAVSAFVFGFGASALLVNRDSAAPTDTAEPLVVPTSEPTFVHPPISPTAPSSEEDFDLFWEVWELLEQNFYGELPDSQGVTYGAIRGLLDTLDDEYTSFIEPSISDVLTEDATGSFEGIGAFVSLREDGKLEIVNVFPGQPAERAGLQSEDRVLAVDGESIVGWGLYEAISVIRGPAGSEVTLLIERPGETETFEVTLVRAHIAIPLVESEMLEDDVAYISLLEFSSTATELVEESLAELLAEEPAGVIFDLRGNPGGWLDQAVGVADIFLGDGIILIERWSDGTDQLFRSYDGDLGEDIPLVVLIDQGSASASEIVAGAIQVRERAVLIGMPSFGKGSVQRPYRLSDGSELRVTTALWFLPNDVAIHNVGLEPDIEVELPEELEPGEDPQLDRAIEYILSGE